MSDVNDISWWNPPERIKQLCLQSDHSFSYNNHGFYPPFKQYYSYITHAPYPVNFRTPMISNEICEAASVYDYNPHSSFVAPFINPRLLVTETSNDLSVYPSSITHSILGQQQREPDQTIEGFVESNSATLLKQSQLAIIPPESRQAMFTSLTENITQITSSPIKTAYSSNNNNASMEENNQGITHTNEMVSTMSSQQHSTNSDIYNRPHRNRFLEEENRRDARRRERNRLAARRHRNKKRYKSDQLESQVHELMVENERLKGLEAEVERLRELLKNVKSEIN